MHRLGLVAGAVALGAAMLGGPVTANAAQARSDFVVKVILDKMPGPGPGPMPPPGDFCVVRNHPAAFGADVTVVCETGVVVELSPRLGTTAWTLQHGGAYRFLPPVAWAGLMTGIEDIHTGLGTTTSWRVIRVTNREYLELTVHW